MGIEIIGKLTQKNNGDFKLVDLENVDYDGTGKSAKQELEKKIEEAKNSSTPYDDTEIKTDINTIKTDLGTETLNTTAKDVKGAVNEVAAQYKDIANKIENGNIGNNIEPQLMDMPRIYFSEGTLPTSKTATMMKFDYYSKTTEYHGWVEIKCQGNSSMGYPKKNFTIKLYKDKAKTGKLKIDFKGWGKQSKFVLKANWIDITHARNVVSARLWGDIIKTRSDYATALPELFRTSPNQGAVDGFPVLVYSNGVYQGRYTLNIPKDKWMSNMDDTLDSHCILCGENYESGCFRALPTINGTDWTDELHDVVPASIKTSWTNVIKFVMTSSDAEFKTNLSNYFDINSLLDYYLYGLISTNLDGFAKNQLYFTYDGIHWIASVYDLDSTWGLWFTGGTFVSTNYSREEFEDYRGNGRNGNLLYIKLKKLFVTELKTRYTELRKEVLSANHIIEKFEEFIQICPKDIVQEDYARTTGGGDFTSIPSITTNNIQQIRSNIVGRLTYVDGYINALQEAIVCTNITLNNATLSFTTDAAQTLTATLTPTDTTDKVVWSVNPTGFVTVNNGVVTPINNGTCVITATCGTKSATCNVTVNLPGEAVTALNLDKDSITLGNSAGADTKFDETLTATLTPTNATNKNVTWTANNENVQLVANGLNCTVKAKAVGSSVVTCTSQDTTNGTITDTCNVTVNAVPEQPGTLYTLPQETTFNGTSDYIDTGVKLFDTSKNATVFIDLESATLSDGVCLNCMESASPWRGLGIQQQSNYYRLCGSGSSSGNYIKNATLNATTDARQKMIINIVNGIPTTVDILSNGSKVTHSLESSTFTQLIDRTLTLGAEVLDNGTIRNYWNGTIYQCKIWFRNLSDSEKNELFS